MTYTYDTDFMRKAVGFVPAQSVDMKWSETDAQGFDTWLAEEHREARAEAWEEGRRAGFASAIDRRSPIHALGPHDNPYKETP